MNDRVSEALKNSFRLYTNPIVFKLDLERVLGKKISNVEFELQFDLSSQVFFERSIFITPSIVKFGDESRRIVKLLENNEELMLPLFKTSSLISTGVRVLNVYGEFSSSPSSISSVDKELESWINERIIEANGSIVPISEKTIKSLNSIGLRTVDIKLGSILLENQKTIITNAHPLVFLNDRNFREFNIVKAFDDGIIEFKSVSRKGEEDVSDKSLSIGLLACANAKFIDINISDHVVIFQQSTGKLVDILAH